MELARNRVRGYEVQFAEISSRALAAANQQRLDAMAALCSRVFRKAGVPHALLKGPSVAHWLYEDPLERSYVDIDFLVDPDCFENAEELLRELGFELAALEALPHDVPKSAHHWGRPSDGSMVDLHFSLEGVTTDPREVWRTLSMGLDSMTIGGQPIPVLTEYARAMHLALHVSQHGLQMESATADLALGIEKIPTEQWTDAADLARNLSAEENMVAGLRITAEGRELACRLGLDMQVSTELSLLVLGTPVAATLERIASLPNGERFAYVWHKTFLPDAHLRVWAATEGITSGGVIGLRLRRIAWILRRLPAGVRAWRGAQLRSERRGRRAEPD